MYLSLPNYIFEWKRNNGWVPSTRLVSPKFLKDLDDGKLDSNRYDIKYNPVYFDSEECLILLTLTAV